MVNLTGYLLEITSRIYENLSHMSATEIIIFAIALIIIISSIFAFIARFLKQPLIPAYVLTGLILGPAVFGFVHNKELIQAFSEIGIALLLKKWPPAGSGQGLISPTFRGTSCAQQA